MRSIPANSLERRVARLERENRRLRSLVGVGLLALGAVALMGQSGLNAVQAERFEVVDSEGNLRALFGIAESGRTVLALYESPGEARFRRAAIWDPRPVAVGPDGEEVPPPPEDEAPADRAGRTLREFTDNLQEAVQTASDRVRRSRDESGETVDETATGEATHDNPGPE